MSERYNHIEEEREIDLGLLFYDTIRGARKLWWLLPLLCVLFSGVLYAYKVYTYRPVYQSKASFSVTTKDSTDVNYGYWFYYDESTASQMASTFPYILESDLLTDLIRQDLGVDYINGSISAEALPNSNLFTMSVMSNNPQDAKRILEAVIDNYPTVSQYVIGNTMLNMIEAANLPTEPVNRVSRAHIFVLGAMVGVFLWCGVIVLYAILRKTVRSESEIRNGLNVPCVGTVPRVYFKKRSSGIRQELSINNRKTGEDFHESFLGISLRLLKQMQEKEQKILAVTATAMGEGTTVVATNIAYALAEMNKRVLYVDASELNGDETGDLNRMLRGQCTPAEVLKRDEKNRIWRMSVGSSPKGAEESLVKESLLRFLHKISDNVDIVVIDTMACEYLSRVASVVEIADMIVYVVRQDYMKTQRIMEGIENVCGFRSFFAGCILSQTEGGIGGYGYGKYGTYYRRYSYYRYGYNEKRRYAEEKDHRDEDLRKGVG